MVYISNGLPGKGEGRSIVYLSIGLPGEGEGRSMVYISNNNTGEIKYLGVTISKDLRWDSHIMNMVNKTNKTLDFLRWTLKIRSIHTKDKAYKAFVRPVLEYACSVWDPYTTKNISKIEAVQRRAAGGGGQPPSTDLQCG